MGAEHRFTARVVWSGSTGRGYDAFDRAHDVAVGEHAWRGSAAAAFRGDEGLTNPEELLVAAAAQCQLLSFLAVAARARLDVVEYRDEPVGVMPAGNRPMWVTRIELNPRITIAAEPASGSLERLHRLSEVAHTECFVAASLRGDVVVSPTFTFAGAVAARDAQDPSA